MPPQLYGGTPDMHLYRGNTTWLWWNDAGTVPYNSSAQNIWGYWTQTNVTASSSAQLIWTEWNQTLTVVPGLQHSRPAIPPPTPEEIERRRERAREAARLQKEAKERARALLLAVLDEKQREELQTDGHFHVQTKDGERVYRLKPGRPPVRIKGEDGSRWSYCIHPRDSFPADDTTAALKLMIEAEEERFLQIANATRVAASAV